MIFSPLSHKKTKLCSRLPTVFRKIKKIVRKPLLLLLLFTAELLPKIADENPSGFLFGVIRKYITT